MRVTFEIEPADVRRFLQALARARRMVRDAEETDLVAAAKHALDNLPIASAPGYVRKRLTEVQRLIVMLEDEAWALTGSEREEVLQTLVYFSDPEDLIPDDVEVIGLLDDAIMLELLLRRLRHVLGAYDDFCAYRDSFSAEASDCAARVGNARRLARKREALHLRMRRRAQSESAARKSRRAAPVM
jgi:uncharacterized membrane protein YkvA (DUF1232 family)